MFRTLPLVAVFAFGCATPSEAPFGESSDGLSSRMINPALADGVSTEPVSVIADTLTSLGSAPWDPAQIETGAYIMTLEAMLVDDTSWGYQAGDSRTVKIKEGDDGIPYLMKKAPMYTDGSRIHASASLQTEINDTCIFIETLTADGSFTTENTFELVIRQTTAAQGFDCINEDGMDMSNPSTMIYVASFEKDQG